MTLLFFEVNMALSFMNNDTIDAIENNLCIGLEESILVSPYDVYPNRRMEKMYDSIIFKYFEVYPTVNFIPDKAKVTLVRKEREV